MTLMTSSWKSPWLRKPKRYSFSDLDSTSFLSGMYRIVIVAKSGWPVLGQSVVNSGAVKVTQ